MSDSLAIATSDNSPAAHGVGLTLFAMPKAFHGHSGLIQRNAIGSWLRLTPRPEIILFGDDAGTAEFAAEHGLIHVPIVRRNENGTPLMDDMFRTAHDRAAHDLLTYINADIILTDDFTRTVEHAAAEISGPFLMIGRRTDVNLFEQLPFDDPHWSNKLLDLARREGDWAPRVCKDYFVFRKPLLADIPPFAIGRAVYDNWFVYDVKRRGLPVVDATGLISAVHQNHGYGHVAGGNRGQAYVRGEESRRNKQLAGGMRLVAGSTTTHALTTAGLRRRSLPSDWPQFLADLPRFLRLVLELYGWSEPAFAKAARRREAGLR
ncbi:MAG: hypothetical protein QM775_24575 [Pirellulales bacterium]